MKMRLKVVATTAVLLCGLVPAAMAQPVPTLEIDFTTAVLPLSPWLTAAIAVVVGACGLYAQRRMRGGARSAALMALGVATASLAGLTSSVSPLGDAQAIVVNQINLGSSPALVALSFGGVFEATNTTSGTITLTAVQIDNPGGILINPAPATTCAVGLSLPSGASCFISVGAPV